MDQGQRLGRMRRGFLVCFATGMEHVEKYRPTEERENVADRGSLHAEFDFLDGYRNEARRGKVVSHTFPRSGHRTGTPLAMVATRLGEKSGRSGCLFRAKGYVCDDLDNSIDHHKIDKSIRGARNDLDHQQQQRKHDPATRRQNP